MRQTPRQYTICQWSSLMGRALGNNLINMTAYKDVKEALEEMGY